MTDTKLAIAALMGLTVDNDFGPKWWQACVAVFQLGLLIYLLWYVWRGAEPLERRCRRAERERTHP